MWSILRALQAINKAKRLEGEAVMSAPPFFQSAGRGDLKSWGEDDGPTVVRYGKVYWNQSRSLVGKDGQFEGLGGLVKVEGKTRRATPV